MKIGDLVIRKLVPNQPWGREQREKLGHGIILSKQMSGRPAHPCISVYYPKTGEIYDIAEIHMEVIGAGR